MKLLTILCMVCLSPLGMLIVGCLLRNVPVINVAKNIDTDWSSALRYYPSTISP